MWLETPCRCLFKRPQSVAACSASRGASQLVAVVLLIPAPDVLAQVENRNSQNLLLSFWKFCCCLEVVGVFWWCGFGLNVGLKLGPVSARGSSWRTDVTEHRLLCVSQSRRTWRVGIINPCLILQEFVVVRENGTVGDNSLCF